MSGIRRPPRRAIAWPIAVSAFIAAMLLAPGGATAEEPAITLVSITPSDGNTLFVARTAANNPLDPPTFQLKADVTFYNDTGAEAVLTRVTFRYSGSAIKMPSTPMIRADSPDDPDDDWDHDDYWTLAPDANQVVPLYHGLYEDLPTPLPATVEIDFEFNGGAYSLAETFDLAFFETAVPLGAFFFPAKANDLDEGEFWFWETRHVTDIYNPSSGNGRYAIDFGVVAWDGSGWSQLVDDHGPTAWDENTDFRIWDMPLYAMGDGVVVACYRGEPDESPKDFELVETHFGAGNSLTIQYGGELVLIGHMQSSSPPQALCPTPAAPGPGLWPSDQALTGLNIPVHAGQYLGRVGNTGYSTAPHLHLESMANPSTGPNTIGGTPLQFVNVRAVADDDAVTDRAVSHLDESATVRPLHRMSLHEHALVRPNPCGFDFPMAGLPEVGRHGIEAECFQDVFNMSVARGYSPKSIDGFEVGGQTYFNATFRPSDTAWQARFGLTGAEYKDLFDELTTGGYRLHQVDSYLEGGNVRYAAIFEIRPGHPLAAFHGLDDAEYAARVAELRDAGYVPLDVSMVEVGGSRSWTGLFEQVDIHDWAIQTVPVADYQDTFDANEGAGRLPIHVNGSSAGATPFITGIWVDPIGGSWAAVHDRSGDQYQGEWKANTSDGLFTRSTTGYDDGAGSPRFAAVWREAPGTVLTSGTDDPTNQVTATFGFASDNPFATFECRLDHGAFEPCASPALVDGLADGTHRFEVRALDRDRVRDPSPASLTWLVDTTPPDINVLAPLLGAKTVNGDLKDDPVEMTTVVGWAEVAAGVIDGLSGVDGVMFTVDAVPVPGAAVTTDGTDWRFAFCPDQKNVHIYAIGVAATDHAGNTATVTIEIAGVRTLKPR
jgi:hypothetical protein